MIPPPCTCGETATGFVVEGHLHPYCAWQAERARAERFEAVMGFTANLLRDGSDPATVEGYLRAALAADREGR